MRIFYTVLFAVFFWISAPFYFLKMWRRGNWRPGFGQRFGRYSAKIKQALTNRHVVWFHAVSVGEVNVCTDLIRALEPRVPNVTVVVSTTTSTGMGRLETLPSHITRIYYPIDFRRSAVRALASVHPEAIVLVEAEIWPNFLWRAFERGIPVFLVNARLSERSYRGYKRFSFLFRPIFAQFAGVGCQNEADANRLRELGFRPEAIHIVGNLKFDAAKLNERSLLDVPGLLRQIGVTPDQPVIVAGSTHAGEEEILGGILKRLRAKFPKLFLVVVPRHFERSKDAARDLEKHGLRSMFRSDVNSRTRSAEGSIVVNSTGELRHFYEQAHVVFVGKSLTAEGGQNPIEPGALGKAMVYGPNMQNFTAIVAAFTEGNGAVQVQDAAGLEAAFERLLSDETARNALGARAREIVGRNLGAADRTVEMILPHLHEQDVYVARRG
jgi:3-deoxy-D-manno-octulosonic-acid transferase